MRWVFAVVLVVFMAGFVLAALGVTNGTCPAGTRPAAIGDSMTCRPGRP